MEKIKVSIVIPVYNVEDYLEDCIQSVLKQSLEEIEVICINDGSTDASQEILDVFFQKDPRVKVSTHIENSGPSVARNIGLSLAKGKYIYFLDSDDMIKKDCLEKLWKISEKYNLDICYFDANPIYQNKQMQEKYKDYSLSHKVICSEVVNGQELFYRFVTNNDWSPSVPRQFFNRQFLINSGLKYEKGILHEDELFSVLAIIKADKVFSISEKLFLRRYRENSIITSTKSCKNIQGLYRCYCKLLEELKHKNNYSVKTKMAMMMILDRLLTSLNSARKKIDIETSIVIDDLYEQYLYECIVDNRCYYKVLEEDIKRIDQNVYVYGTGAIAEQITSQLSAHGIVIDAYVVSDPRDNPSVFLGHPVISVDELKENITVVVATSTVHHLAIANSLSRIKKCTVLYSKYNDEAEYIG